MKTFNPLLFLLSLLLSSSLYAEFFQFKGKATTDDGHFYDVWHTVELKGKKFLKSKSEYYSPTGKLIALIDNDYTKQLKLPVYEYRDLRTGQVNGVRHKKDNIYEMYAVKKSGDEERTEEFNYSEKLLAGQGLNYFLVENLGNVKKGQVLPFDLVIPGELDSYAFVVTVEEITKKETTFKAEIDNWFLSLFAPTLLFKFDNEKKRLTYYKGLSNVKTDSGKLVSIEVTYDYKAKKDSALTITKEKKKI